MRLPDPAADTPTRRLLTVKDAAAELSIGRSTLYELIAAGELRPVRIGRALRIPTSELDRFVAERLEDAP
ncbi:MAG: helix-turn-helix domain-containing protein [Candidatus Limnocylindria bacterium]